MTIAALDTRTYWGHILDAIYCMTLDDENGARLSFSHAERYGPVPDFLPGMVSQVMGEMHTEDEVGMFKARADDLTNQVAELNAHIEDIEIAIDQMKAILT